MSGTKGGPRATARSVVLACLRIVSIAAVVVAPAISNADDSAIPCRTLPIDDALRQLNAARLQSRVCGATTSEARQAPLLWNETLAAAALHQSRDMAMLQRMSHRDAQDRNLAARLQAQGYRYASAVENVAAGFGSLEDVIAAWLKSQGHCENLMDGSVVELGLACTDGTVEGRSSSRRYWTLVLAAPKRPTLASTQLVEVARPVGLEQSRQRAVGE